MSNRSVDLFDDPGWPTLLPVGRPAVDWHRRILWACLALVSLLIISMVLPWFTSAETSPWTPFSHWLDLGWSPGTQNWAFLLLGLATCVAVGTGLALWSPTRFVEIPLFIAATSLLVVTLLETSAHLSVDPGPNLHADYGAVIGAASGALLWVGIACTSLMTPDR